MGKDESDWQICAETRDRLGESVLWHPVENALYWIDYYGPHVHRQKGAGGPVETWNMSGFSTIGSLVFADDGILLAMDHGLHFLDMSIGSLKFFADPKGGRMDLAYNDSKVDRAGRYWVGTLSVEETSDAGSFYHVRTNGEAVVADRGFVICNGPTFSPDNRKLYFSDSVERRILRYDLDESGAVSDRRTFHQFATEDGLPDGLAVDRVGNIWCALYGGGKVVCLDPDGVLMSSLPIPAAYPTSLCFGGPDFATIFVTTGVDPKAGDLDGRDKGGSVFSRRVGISGLPEPVLRFPQDDSRRVLARPSEMVPVGTVSLADVAK